MSASISQATVHLNESSKNSTTQNSDQTSQTQNQSRPTDHQEDQSDTMQDYDPKYGGKSTFPFDVPSLKRIKHKISFSGTVVLCVVGYLIYQQFGKQSLGKTKQEHEQQVTMRMGGANDGSDVIFRQVDPVNPMGVLDSQVPEFKPPPAHLRPGYVAPPGDPNQPANQQPAFPGEPADRPPFRKQQFGDNRQFGENDEFGDGGWGEKEEPNDFQQNVQEDRDSNIQQARDEEKQDQYAKAINAVIDDEFGHKVAPPGVAHGNLLQDEGYAQNIDAAKERHRQQYVERAKQQAQRPAVQSDKGDTHDFHAVRQRYEAKKEAKPQLADQDLSRYAALGQQAVAKKERQQQLQDDHHQEQFQKYGAVKPAGRPGAALVNPYEEYIRQKGLEKDIRPHPKDWPVRVLKEPSLGCLAGVEVLLVVHTHPSTFGTRRAIRASWGTQTEDKYPRLGATLLWRTVFVLGRDDTKQWANEVTTEQNEFGDILQGDFEDNQYEGTRKFLLALEWLTRNLKPGCEPRFILKTEENIYHNMNSIIGWIHAKYGTYEDPDTEKSKGIYIGKKLIRDIPIRDGRDPYYVPWQDYEKTYFPDMIQGPEFFYDYETYKKLERETRNVPKIAMEEGYICLLAERAGVTAAHNEHFILLEETSNICHMLRMFFVSDVRPSEHKKIFKNTREALTNGKCPNAHVIEHGQRRVNIEM